MELKLFFCRQFKRESSLLIVPYGIETGMNFEWMPVPDYLLIVPYGIETYAA